MADEESHDPAPRSRVPTATATTWVAIGSAINGLAAFGFQLVGTRALGPGDYAPIGVLWTLQYLWIAVAVTAVEAYVTRMATRRGTGSPHLERFLRLYARWLALTAVITAGVGWLFRDAIFDGLGSLAIALGLVVLGYGWYGVVRGRQAGAQAFGRYSIATAMESGVRLVAAVAVLAVTVTTRGLAWVFPVGPFAVIAWARLRTPHDTALPEPSGADIELAPAEQGRGRRFLAAASIANASVQFLLAGGPLVLLPLGADPVAISVFFTTITAARVPMTFALNGGLSRLLPPLTRLSEADDGPGLRRAAGRLIAAVLGMTLLAAAGGALIGPEVIALLFGEGFRPGRFFVVLVAVTSVLAVGGLLIDQVYIATGREHRLPAVWVMAVVLAGALITVIPGTPTMRVAAAFAAATAVAVTVLSIPLLRPR